MEIKASDRTYIRDAKGTMRVADYKANGVENSDIYTTMIPARDTSSVSETCPECGRKDYHEEGCSFVALPFRPSGKEVSSPEPRQ
jgi:hypothetical protein